MCGRAPLARTSGAVRGVRVALVMVPEGQVDRLADEGYLDGDNTVTQAIEAFLANHMRFSHVG